MSLQMDPFLAQMNFGTSLTANGVTGTLTAASSTTSQMNAKGCPDWMWPWACDLIWSVPGPFNNGKVGKDAGPNPNLPPVFNLDVTNPVNMPQLEGFISDLTEKVLWVLLGIVLVALGVWTLLKP